MSVSVNVHSPAEAVVRDIKDSACWLRIEADGEGQIDVCFDDRAALEAWLRAALNAVEHAKVLS